MSTSITLDAPIKGTPFDLLDPVTGEHWIARPVFADSHGTRAMWMIHIPAKGGKPEHRLVSSERMPHTLRDWLFQWERLYSRTVTGCKLRHVQRIDLSHVETAAADIVDSVGGGWSVPYAPAHYLCKLSGYEEAFFRCKDEEEDLQLLAVVADFLGVDIHDVC